MGGFSRCVPDANRCVPRCVSVRSLKRIDVFLGADWCGYWGGIIILTSGTLVAYLADIDTEATEMYDRLVQQFAKQEGISEQLKADNQMMWVQMMNNIRNRATEIVNAELVYC